MDFIRQTIKFKNNKYTKGDCLSIHCETGKYLGIIISCRFNKYYDITLMHLYQKRKLDIKHFLKGKFWGTRFGWIDDIEYAVDICMIECKYIDSLTDIELVGKVDLIEDLQRGSYDYKNNISELLKYYLSELPIRIEKSKNAENFPELGFVSKHLIELSSIIV